MNVQLVLPLLLLALVLPVSAHELVRDGQVGAMMHFEPVDKPVAGRPNKVTFDLVKQGGEKVTLSSCTCTLQVYSGVIVGGKPLLSSPLRQDPEGKAPFATVRFPKDGAYTLMLTGEPTDQSFSAFTLRWPIKVR